jgi:hypothetical protein
MEILVHFPKLYVAPEITYVVVFSVGGLEGLQPSKICCFPLTTATPRGYPAAMVAGLFWGSTQRVPGLPKPLH